MKSNIFIPKQINVGYQNRTDTYTGKLAYVIYFDNKNKLRKEASWNSWRKEELGNDIYDNTPIEGFVLNKKVGDYVSDWNHRQAYVRVYDPRNFEFEITIENLLYILENTSSIKGKGLEGEFVYGWDGKDLILLPTSSPDYQELKEFTDLVYENKKFKAKELIIGATYKDKSLEEWIYMGRFDKWTRDSEKVYRSNSRYDYDYIYKDINKGKHHFFVREKESWRKGETYLAVLTLKSLGDKFIDIVSDKCVKNYSDLFDQLERKTDYSPYDSSKDEFKRISLENIKNEFNERGWNYYLCDYNGIYKRMEGHKVYNTKKEEHEDDIIEVKLEENYRTNLIFKGSIEEFYNKLKPSSRTKYLANGKLYEEGSRY